MYEYDCYILYIPTNLCISLHSLVKSFTIMEESLFSGVKNS